MPEKLHEVLCWNCRKRVSYRIKARKEERIIKGVAYLFDEKYALCEECGEEITVPGLDDENDRVVDNIYRKENDLITIDDINAILEKYDIEKRPLSRLLGFGELTITRYLDGQLPSKKYSTLLQRLLKYDEEMKKLLKTKGGSITEVAYQKVQNSIAQREYLWGHDSKIEIVALYMIDSLYEITNLSLQKLLYYFKALGLVFFKEDILKEQCEAWVHGPVFVKIYEKYKSFGREPIRNEYQEIEFDKLLTEDEINLCNYVLENFAIYNGNILREFTHRERPWIEAREGLGETERCTNIIMDSCIETYFTQININYDLKKKEGVSSYIKSLNVI